MTSHAAVVARAMGKPCVLGCGSLSINEKRKSCILNGKLLKELEVLTLDGSTGQVIRGAVKLVQPRLGTVFNQIMKHDGCDRVDL